MLHVAVIFLSSFLLFLVQPLIARLILPWFGGTAAVWTTCMLFFQTVLLAGYAYAHATNAKLAPRAQALVHTVLLAAAVLLMPVAPGESWKPTGSEEPISYILLMLVAAVGLPYFLLSSTSPLVQAWFARAKPGENPYRLFAVSNLASLLALIGYPTVVEPLLGNAAQVGTWSWLFAGFAVLCALLAWTSAKPLAASVQAAQDEGRAPTRGDYASWIALGAAASALLLAVTNHVTQDVAAIPLLWLAPLTLYLLTFIVCFEGQGFYRPQWMWAAVLAALGGMAYLLYDRDYQFNLMVQLGTYLPGLFIACVFCHGELYRSRPSNRHLTAFYLSISAGGALGGFFVAVVAPLAFNLHYELGLSIAAVALLAALRLRNVNLVARFASLAVLAGVVAACVHEGIALQKDVVESRRNFYGMVRVKEYGTPGESGHLRRMLHGVIMHGEQSLDPEKRRNATTYYQTTSGVGVAIRSRADRPSVKVGVIGLGTGTLAVYGRKGDTFRFYDINPQVIELAQSRFTYLADAAKEGTTIEKVLGDARLSLEREAPQGFDVLAVDAFSSDAIPVHLITREALQTYLKHLKPDGIVAFHVSNRFLELVPVVGRLAKEAGAHAVVVYEKGDEDRTQSDWVLVSRDPNALKGKLFDEVSAEAPEEKPEWRTWTDDYSNLVQILK